MVNMSDSCSEKDVYKPSQSFLQSLDMKKLHMYIKNTVMQKLQYSE
jgi:hypothetical protein